MGGGWPMRRHQPASASALTMGPLRELLKLESNLVGIGQGRRPQLHRLGEVMAFACEHAKIRYDLAIVGGDAPCIGAARRLAAKGKAALLLEASSRLGGRAFTQDRGGYPLDLGCE